MICEMLHCLVVFVMIIVIIMMGVINYHSALENDIAKPLNYLNFTSRSNNETKSTVVAMTA